MYMGKDNSKNFFASAMANRLSMLPGASPLAAYGNGSDGASSAAAYNSRVLASQTNGAGPTTMPIQSPFSFGDFITGRKSLTIQNSPAAVSGQATRRRFH